MCRINIKNPIIRLVPSLYTCLFISQIYSNDTIKVLFVYGSKPKAKTESKWFGGIHGGHVSISYSDGYMSFIPNGRTHLFKRKKTNSVFTFEKENDFVFDTSESRYLIVSIPVSRDQKTKLDSILKARSESPTYNYAFFGYRCASSVYEILSMAGILPNKSELSIIYGYFYPKLLRTHLLREAREKSWSLLYRPGRNTRKWEDDLKVTSKRK